MEKKIAIVGVGGVGGYIAAMLAKTFSHVTIVARGERGKKIREEGIVLHGEYNGEIVGYPEVIVESGEELQPQDIIFLCVKNYSLEEACRQMKEAVMDHTIIIPVINGPDPGERVRRCIGRGIVLNSLIYITAFFNEDYSITQKGKFADLCFGMNEKQKRDKLLIKEIEESVNLVGDVLEKAGIDFKVSTDIEHDIWKKYIMNCAYNVITAYYNENIGAIRSNQKKAEEFERLACEAYTVAEAKGIHVCVEDLKFVIHRFYKVLAADSTSSLMRDMAAGRMAEIETFPGFIVHESKRLGLEVPVSKKMYEGLFAKMNK